MILDLFNYAKDQIIVIFNTYGCCTSDKAVCVGGGGYGAHAHLGVLANVGDGERHSVALEVDSVVRSRLFLAWPRNSKLKTLRLESLLELNVVLVSLFSSPT